MAVERDEVTDVDRAADLKAARLTSDPAFVAGYEVGLAHGRAQVEGQLLRQEELLAEVEHRWRRWVLELADVQRLARALTRAPSHLELVQRRHFAGPGPAGPAARALLLAATGQHARVWAGWPRRHTA
jgi:hypothetical protein